MTKKNPKQRLILYPNKDATFKIRGMFCKTLERAKYIFRQRRKEYLNRVVFYDGKGIATKLI